MAHPYGAKQDRSQEPREMSADRDPWERQRGESKVGFDAFKVYRDMCYNGAGFDNGRRRSIREVAETLGKHVSGMHRYSRIWHWVGRTEAYDADMDLEHRAQLRANVLASRREQFAVSRRVLQLIGRSLEATENDKKILLPTNAIAPALKVAAEVQRAALGEADRYEMTMHEGTEVASEFVWPDGTIHDTPFIEPEEELVEHDGLSPETPRSLAGPDPDDPPAN